MAQWVTHWVAQGKTARGLWFETWREQTRQAKKMKIRNELTPDRAWGDAALCSRDFRVNRGEQG